ncbi:radical SAM protein [Neptunitalea lumnitzerae]|uniref:radical SAM protein n=1 Tax=Neptunitalea lumnitzerae TaxID=2965509 RepID=UPI00248FACE5|nr:radical SAM protein [Neptunitalea sp. Y10]
MAVNLDPVMACNLRCKMCYFTDKDYVKKLKGQLTDEEVQRIASQIFGRALKLQIGCGTEPTLYKKLPELVALGKQYEVPYISITTNANLLTLEKAEELLKAGLDEFTVSLHGVTKHTYEDFMGRGDYEKFCNAMQAFAALRSKYNFKVRVNYTFNQDNFEELKDIFNHFDGNSFDILQIRPIQKIGNTEYNNFDVSGLKTAYQDTIGVIKSKCTEHNILLLAPDAIGEANKSDKINTSSFIYDYTFCYISPNFFWKKDFDWKEESFESYCKRIGWSKDLLFNVFRSKNRLKSLANRLNYEIEFN